MKKVWILLASVLLFVLLLFLFVKKDNGNSDFIIDTSNIKQNPFAVEVDGNYPLPKTKTIDGVDYIESQAGCGKFGGKLVISTIGEGPKTFNPYTATDATSAAMSEIMFDGLFTSAPMNGDVIPKLAKSVEIKGNNYIIHIRKGLKWSDGKPITAEDVMFTWKDIIFAGLGNTSVRDSMIIDGELPKITKLDNYTVMFTVKRQFAPFLRMLSAPIAPKHYFTKDKNWVKNFDRFLASNTKPSTIVSSGAFRLKEYVPAQRVIFERNSNYYEINKKGQKLPYLDKIVYLIVGDLNNEILKFEAGELDEISLRGGNVARYKAKENNSDYVIYNLGADTGTMFVAINLNNRYYFEKGTKKYYVNPVKQKWFSDVNFRTALDYALDRKNMVQNIANGMATPLFTAESKNSVFLNKDLKGYDKDIEKAKSYLKKSGFYLKNSKLYDKYGNRVEINLLTNAGNTEREAIGVMIKQDFADLGIQVNFKPIEFNSLVNKITNSYDWEMVILGLTGTPVEPHNGKNVWYSSGPLHLFNQRPVNTPITDKLSWEKQLDDIFDKASLVLDFKSRKKYYDRYQRIIYEQKPIIYLYSPIRIYAIRNKFKNIYPSSLSGLTHNIVEIYIDNKRVKE